MKIENLIQDIQWIDKKKKKGKTLRLRNKTYYGV